MLIQPHHRNVIFDLGGILINLSYQNTFDAFARLGAPQIKEVFGQLAQTDLFDKMETGKLEDGAFRQGLRELLNIDANDHAIDNAWNAMLLDFPAERIQVLHRLMQTHKVYLLSNNNAIHMREIGIRLQQQFAIAEFKSCFHHAYYSYEVGMRKPHREIFDFVLEDAGLDPKETLFIDDSLPNIEGALKTGIEAVHLTRGVTLADFGL